ncbi:hypothetical protein P171DRAFT_52297 [Karstenula rhodostoma CBS 690.94]|uniref:Uncharacterized protein n=1 Tax=Karstenula rhodostoma CBS 690.94 TaxID=1392251 RepID=A0A9P4PDA9_9PLEO|nr:hypothetical protein P171DRAFT_52297 [Karstenula rhodostoma CBS 690.94]
MDPFNTFLLKVGSISAPPWTVDDSWCRLGTATQRLCSLPGDVPTINNSYFFFLQSDIKMPCHYLFSSIHIECLSSASSPTISRTQTVPSPHLPPLPSCNVAYEDAWAEEDNGDAPMGRPRGLPATRRAQENNDPAPQMYPQKTHHGLRTPQILHPLPSRPLHRPRLHNTPPRPLYPPPHPHRRPGHTHIHYQRLALRRAHAAALGRRRHAGRPGVQVTSD